MNEWLYYTIQYLEPNAKSKGVVADVTINSLVAWRSKTIYFCLSVELLSIKRSCWIYSCVGLRDKGVQGEALFSDNFPPTKSISSTFSWTLYFKSGSIFEIFM